MDGTAKHFESRVLRALVSLGNDDMHVAQVLGHELGQWLFT
jgi:predicted Zn-dependent protease